ncbi:hypothetical protein GGQ68_001414 [Sagittula marina]|uniref:Uncharacterized protein n=1 Tax=Sagittula marina TaxID=943940 RepID=A0A7W6GRM9_9RHOB|nr:hypothetical protein [Sagittula marina]MBB3985085.1 hypothetical protein [Sagittula marina]
MWDWVVSNSSGLNTLLNIAMLLVWIGYLQVFLMSFQRANRAMIHIDSAVQDGRDARCIIANMGSEAVYVVGVQVKLTDGDKTVASLVSDRSEHTLAVDKEFRGQTLQGPLAPGESLDVGSFRNLCSRAAYRLGQDLNLDNCTKVEITVAIAAQQAHRILGAHKSFSIEGDESANLSFRPDRILTEQISSRRRRKALEQRMLEISPE